MAKRDGDRPSWRDIDRRKDSSSHIDRNDPYKKQRRGHGGDTSKNYKAALDNFFDGGTLPERYQKLTKARDTLKKDGGSPRQAALKELRSAIGRSDVEKALKAYFAVDDALPRDPDALLNVLLHSDEALVRDAIELLGSLVEERPIKRQELLRQRLRQIEDLAEEDRTASAAESLRRKL